MHYDKELAFVNDLLRNFRLEIYYLHENTEYSSTSPNDLLFRKLLNHAYDRHKLFRILSHHCKSNRIYQACGVLNCTYLYFLLPNTGNHTIYAYIGPYASEPISEQDVLKIADRYHVAPDVLPQIEQFYQELPIIADDSIILTILYTLGMRLWGGEDSFSFEKVTETLLEHYVSFEPHLRETHGEDALLSMQLLEERYDMEHRLMQAVSAGQLHKAELVFSDFSTRQMEQRVSNPLRNIKNYLFVLNTVLRIAAKNGAVHPLHIDRISSDFAKKIELITSEHSGNLLTKEMIRKYCMLVKNHSLKGYSLLIRKVITRIETDLTADLSLKTQAALLHVNSSYLSGLFKKETGMTLTEYVNRKRITHGIFLLNSTDMQIQTVAEYCGVTDVNYFSKVFKKVVGMTPREYREKIGASTS